MGTLVLEPGSAHLAYCEFLRNHITKGTLVSGAGNPNVYNCSAYGNSYGTIPSNNSFVGGANNYPCNCALDGNGYYYKTFSAYRAPNYVWNASASSVYYTPCDTVADPMFANPSAGDLRVLAVAPSARAGDQLSSASKMLEYEAYAQIDVDGRAIAASADGSIPLGARQEVANGYVIEEPAYGGLALTGTTWGVHVVPDGSTATFTVSHATGTRPCTGFTATYADGRVVTNLFADLPGGAKTYTVDSLATSVRVEPIYTTDWYVDAENGDDANDGFTAATAKKTLVGVLTNANVIAGDTVHAAAGTYDEGKVRPTATSTVFTRVVVPAGVSLVSDEGKDVTFIVGEDAPSPDKGTTGLGADAVSCAWLKSKARLVGFTLKDGRANNTAGDTADKVGGVYGYGAGKTSQTDYNDPTLASIAVDCDILNCNGGVTSCIYGGAYVRCQMLNFGPQGSVGIQRCTLVDCRVRSNCLATFGYYVVGYHSTIYPRSGYTTTRGADYCSLFNCIVAGQCDSAGQEYHGCTFVTNASYTCWSRNVYAYQSDFPDCTFNAVSDLKLDANDKPTSPDGVAVDATLAAYEPTAACLFSDTDLAGNPRTMNYLPDVGCYEWDIRPEMKAILGARIASVDWVTSNAVVTAGSQIMLDGDGAALTATKQYDSPLATMVTFSGAGTLTVLVDDVAAATTAQDGLFQMGEVADGAKVELVYEGEGSVTLGRLISGKGLVIIFR